MMSNILITSILLLFISFVSTEDKKDPDVVVQEAVTAIQSMVKECGGDDIEYVAKMALFFGQFVPVIDRICGMTYDMLSEEPGPVIESLERIQRKLEIIDRGLTGIGHKLDEIRNLIVNSHKKNHFDKGVLKIGYILRAHQRYIGNPTPIVKENFIDECKDKNIIGFVHWIHSEVVSNKSVSLMHVLVDDFNHTKFINVAKDLILIYTRATYAHALCVNAKNYSKEDIDKTLKKDFSDLEQKMREMRNGFKQFNNDIKTNFWKKKAQKDTQKYMDEATGLELNELADQVLRKLEFKYFWRAWIVISYKVYENLPPEHIGSKYYYDPSTPYSGHFFDSKERGLFVGSRDRIQMQIPPRIDDFITKSCFEQKPSNYYPVFDLPEENWDYIDKCWTKGYVNGQYCAVGTHPLGKILERCKPFFNNEYLDYQLFVVIRNDDKIAVKYSKTGNKFTGYGFGLIHRKLGYFNRPFKFWYPFANWVGSGIDYLATPMYAYVWKSYTLVFFYNYTQFNPRTISSLKEHFDNYAELIKLLKPRSEKTY